MQPTQKKEKLNDFWFRIIGMPLVGIMVPLAFYRLDTEIYKSSMIHGMIISTIITVIMWETGRLVIIYYRNKFPALEQTPKRALRIFVGLLLTNLVVSLCAHEFYNYSMVWNHYVTWTEYAFDYGISVFMLCFIGSIYEMIYFFRKWKQTYTDREKLQEEKMQSQLDALRSQINPHFLFNSLNTLEALTEEKHENSTQFVRELANVYRFILQSQDKKLNTLKEELDFISAYSFLLKTRFGDNLTLTIVVEECDHVKQLPPLTLQLLVENAMKHNIISSSKPLHIKITSVEDNLLSVTNKLQKKSQTIASTKIGLNNISQRYQILGERKIVVEETAHEFKVTVPLMGETP